MVNPIQDLIDMANLFGDVASNGPVEAVLLLAGAVFVAFSSLVMAYLTAGAVVDFLIPESAGRPPARQR
ncbi:hypothetical protein BRD15_10015 [Halobacteriales archaeon SW_6_65_15]|jgi:hypothetical protein|nr:MAG: hypothetical protein BRD15_10015 [Halobacteriales archaeon SW_6_65_15]